MKIAYFVHDLDDAAVRKRCRMLKAAGADLTVIGFRRGETAPTTVEGAPAVDLGRTADAKLAQRCLSVLRNLVQVGRLKPFVRDADVIMARNLEVLLLARGARALIAPRAVVVYECLDIHRMMLGDGLASKALRGLERMLLGSIRRLIVSSPAFLNAYFVPRQRFDGPSLLLENKLLRLGGSLPPPPPARPPVDGPWRIGWFGVIRCQKSLDMLCALAEASEGRLEVVIRGRPARHEFRDFDAQVAAAQGVRFEGAYTPDDLPRCYGEVHFAWAIDYFEEGQNSTWLLPNRLYEAGAHGVPPIALVDVETGHWLAAREAGLLLGDPVAELGAILKTLDAPGYEALRAGIAAIPVDAFVAGEDECRRLVAALGEQARA